MLGVCWSKDGRRVLSGGADNAVQMYDLGSMGNAQQVARHDAPIKCVRWVETPQGGLLATGSWDKTIKVRLPSFTSLLHTMGLSFCFDFEFFGVDSTGTSVNHNPCCLSPSPNGAMRWT